MYHPDALTFAMMMSYFDNKQVIDVSSQHCVWIFEAWMAALVARLEQKDGGDSGRGGLTGEPIFA